MMEDQDATFVQGDTQIFVVSVVDGDGVAVDLTNAAIEYRIGNGDTTLTKTPADDITVTDAVGGAFEVLLTATETADLERGYRHAVEITDSNGDVSTVLTGSVLVKPDSP